MKQSSIRWLNDELGRFELGTSEFYSKTAIINRAERMHKEEIIEAAERWKGTDFAEQYYNETYGGDK